MASAPFLTPSQTAEAIEQRFAAGVLDITHFRGESTAVVSKESLLEVCRFCKEELGYDYLSDLTAVDWLDRRPRFDVVYHLISMTSYVRFRLKVQTDEGEAVPTVVRLWAAANWAEREVWDLFGIDFAGHPDLRRIQMPEGWIGHPLRKDYPQSQITLPRPKTDKTET